MASTKSFILRWAQGGKLAFAKGLSSSCKSVKACLSDQKGVTVIEFAVAGPVLIILLMGIFDIGHMAYLSSVLRGAVQQAARSDSLESANVTQADAYVDSMVQRVMPGAQIEHNRVSYYDFADIARAESWNDSNSNGRCDNGEHYVDENRSGRWDADVGASGNGGPNDVVLYTVTVKYKPLFFVPFVDKAGEDREVVAKAVKKNQPYALQQKYSAATGRCS